MNATLAFLRIIKGIQEASKAVRMRCLVDSKRLRHPQYMGLVLNRCLVPVEEFRDRVFSQHEKTSFTSNIYDVSGLVSREAVQEIKVSRAPVAHAYNPSYSGGRDQEDLGLKPARANSL
jgi:hypothetical protein